MTLEETAYGIKIQLPDGVRNDMNLLQSSVADLISFVGENKIEAVLCEIEDPNPKQNKTGVGIIANMLANQVKHEVKIAVYSKHFNQQTEAVELESIISEKGVPIKYFSNEKEAEQWLNKMW